MKNETKNPVAGHLFLGCAFLAGGVLLVGRGMDKPDWFGPSLPACCLSLALAATVNPKLKSVTFTFWILTGVALGISFSKWFIAHAEITGPAHQG